MPTLKKPPLLTSDICGTAARKPLGLLIHLLRALRDNAVTWQPFRDTIKSLRRVFDCFIRHFSLANVRSVNVRWRGQLAGLSMTPARGIGKFFHMYVVVRSSESLDSMEVLHLERAVIREGKATSGFNADVSLAQSTDNSPALLMRLLSWLSFARSQKVDFDKPLFVLEIPSVPYRLAVPSRFPFFSERNTARNGYENGAVFRV